MERNNDSPESIKEKITKYRILVKEGRNVTGGIWDLVDTPDTRVEISVPLSLEKRQLTRTVEARSNPLWNEFLVFHVDTKDEHLAECEILLIEDNFPLPDVQKGYIKSLLSDLGTVLEFDGKRFVDIKVERSIVEVDAANPRAKIYQLYKTNLRPVNVLRLHIKEGRNISNGHFWDLVDTPDTLVEVTVKLSPERKRRTKTVETKGNPVWNETLEFHFDPRMEEDIMCEFTLIEDNYPLPSVEKGYRKFPISNIPRTITFEMDRAIDIDVNMETVEPDLKAGKTLCDDEIRFCEARRRRVYTALQQLLCEESPKDIKHVPNIAILASGGGFRAMVGLSGAMNALQTTGVLNCASYSVGLSGSAWYLTTLYSHPEWPNCSTSVVSEEIKENIKQHPDTVALNIPGYISSAREKTNYGVPWSLTDIFGHMIGDTIIKGRKNVRWSEQAKQVRNGECPLPLLACVHAYDRISAEEFCEWIEMSPFKVYMPKYGASIKMEDLGSKFFRGKIYEKGEEPPLHFIQGVCGSAFSILHDRLEDFNQGNDEKKGNPFENIVSEIKNSLSENLLDTREGRSAYVPNMMRSVSFEPCFQPIFRQLSHAVSRMWEPLPSISDFLCIIDAGLSFNLPYPLVLDPERDIDVIISFDFSDRGSDSTMPFKELKAAEQWARKFHLSFPSIDVEKYENMDVLELYVFEDEEDPDCPIIMHFVLVNKDFRHFIQPGIPRQTEEDIDFGNFSILDDPDDAYNTFRFQYNDKDFDRLCKLMEFNVLNNLQKIKECIQKGVAKRQKKTSK